jgi:hypothetical protein
MATVEETAAFVAAAEAIAMEAAARVVEITAKAEATVAKVVMVRAKVAVVIEATRQAATQLAAADSTTTDAAVVAAMVVVVAVATAPAKEVELTAAPRSTAAETTSTIQSRTCHSLLSQSVGSSSHMTVRRHLAAKSATEVVAMAM